MSQLSQPAILTSDLRSNFRQLYADIFWYGVLAGSSLAFIAVFAARLGATSFQVGLLTAGPAVVNLLFSLPAGRWLERRLLTRTVFLASIWNRAGFLALIPLPWLLPPAIQVWALPCLVVFMSIPGTLLAIAFNAMFADVVPPEWRGQVVGQRNALVAIGLTTTSLLCGWLLDHIAFPLNYQIVFGIGALGAGLSTYALGHIRSPAVPPPRVGRPLHDSAQPGLLRLADAVRQAAGLRFLTRAGDRPLLRPDLLRGPFGPFLAAYFLFYTFQYVAVPLTPLFWVQALHLSDGAISLGSAIFYATMLLASMVLARVSARYGHHRVLVFGAMFYGLYPLLTGLAKDALLYYAASLIGGAVWALTGGGLVSQLMERVPEGDRPAHMALHNLALNLGILCGSLLGPALGDRVGLQYALFAGAGLRALAALLLAVWG